MIEAFNIMQDRITRSRMAGDPPDVLITPRVGPVGWFDFHKAADAIRLGEEAAEKALPAISEAIAALSMPAAATNGGNKITPSGCNPASLRFRAPSRPTAPSRRRRSR